MARQDIDTGTTANDGTGDTLRSAGTKINQNFIELYQTFGSDSNTLGTGNSFVEQGVQFQGTTNSTILTAQNSQTDVTITLGDSDGEVVTLSSDNIVYLRDSTGATSKIYYGNVFSAEPDLPNADTWHGMFAHVHYTGRGYYAHNGNWIRLLDSSTFSMREDLQLITPKIEGAIFDNSKNFEIISLENVGGSPVNNIKFQNALTGEAPTINVEGNDTDIDLKLEAKNAGGVKLSSALIYDAEVLGIGSDSALDSASNFYIFNSAGARRFKLHDGRASGEVKRFINRRNIDITLEVNSGKFETFAGTFNQVTIGERMAFTCLWDGIGQQWYVDRDSDIHLVFA